jgi:hypothetical protein
VDYSRDYSRALRYARTVVNPDVHALLHAVAAEDDDRFPQSKEVANVILGSGDTNLWPQLGLSLATEGHPLAKALPWAKVERGLQIDDALHGTRLIDSGSGLNAVVRRFGELPPHRQLFHLGDDAHAGVTVSFGDRGWQVREAAVPAAIPAEIKRRVPDATDAEVAAAVERAHHRARVLRTDQRAASVTTGYDAAVANHLRDPQRFPNHPDNYHWRHYDHTATVVRPHDLLSLPTTHARRYGTRRVRTPRPQ